MDDLRQIYLLLIFLEGALELLQKRRKSAKALCVGRQHGTDCLNALSLLTFVTPLNCLRVPLIVLTREGLLVLSHW